MEFFFIFIIGVVIMAIIGPWLGVPGWEEGADEEEWEEDESQEIAYMQEDQELLRSQYEDDEVDGPVFSAWTGKFHP